MVVCFRSPKNTWIHRSGGISFLLRQVNKFFSNSGCGIYDSVMLSWGCCHGRCKKFHTNMLTANNEEVTLVILSNKTMASVCGIIAPKTYRSRNKVLKLNHVIYDASSFCMNTCL